MYALVLSCSGVRGAGRRRRRPCRRRAVDGGLQTLHRVVHPRRDRCADGGAPRAGATQAGPGQHRGRARGAEGRRDRCLSRIPGHHRRRDPEEPAADRPGRNAPAARRHRAGRRRAAGLPEHLRAGNDRGAGRCVEREPHQRPGAAPHPRARAVARVPRARRRLARPGRALRPDAAAHRHRPRHRLRSAGQRPHRGHRHLLHRRQDRVARAGGAGRRPAVLSALRRGAAVPARPAAARARSLARDRGARRAHPAGAHDRDERRRRTARPELSRPSRASSSPRRPRQPRRAAGSGRACLPTTWPA